MKKLLNKIKDTLTKKKIKDFEIYIERCGGSTVEVKEGKVEALEKDDSLGFGLRILLKKGSAKHIGFSYGTAFDQKTLDSVTDQAEASAKYTSADSLYDWVQGPQNYPQVGNFDSQLSQVSKQDKINIALEMEKTGLAFNPKIKRVRYTTFEETIEENLLFNTVGIDVARQRSHVSLNLMALAEEGNESEMAYEDTFSPFWKDLNPHVVAKKAAQMAVDLLGGKKIPNYKGPIILHPSVATEMLEILAPSTTADSVHKKNSFLVGKLGQKVYSPSVTIIDDGLYPLGPETSPFDSEGTPCQTTKVIDKGVVKTFLYDSYWARKDKVNSTGNSLRDSTIDEPDLDITNFYVQKGETSHEDLIKKLETGVLVTEVIGMHTADPISGDFSVGIQGFMIQKGTIGHPIKSVALSGNLHDFFSNVVEIGNNLKFQGNYGSPSLLIKEASISGD